VDVVGREPTDAGKPPKIHEHPRRRPAGGRLRRLRGHPAASVSLDD
jgi:hypothetical protein